MAVDPRMWELVTRLAGELTKDITHLHNKDWLRPAVISHIAHLTGENEAKIGQMVHSWWPVYNPFMPTC